SKVEIPIKSNMVPNIYCTVTVIQPNSSSDNDRPVRITGTIPISVNDPETVQKLNVTIPEYLRPNETFKCKIHADGETQFTIAVVDEGLLSITDFTSPDAWKNFYQKIRLGVGFYDLYGFVIGANKGPVSNTFSVGGGLAERAKMLNDVNANRFKPVSLFKGPLKTDKNGNAEVEFTMPEYVGAVRVMAVSANKGKYGSFEKLVKVKTELIAMPSVPRVMTTGDEVEIPVIIFSMDEKIKETVVQIELGGVLFTEETSKKITFAGIENKTVYFKIRAKDQVGKGDIKITAKSGSYKYESNTEIAVKPLAPREFRTITKAVEKGGSVNFHIPEYISSTVNSSVTISKIKMPDINKRLGYLIGYPYGCLEQTVSKGFSQLSVKPLLKQHSAVYEEIDKNINSAISKLRSFQNSTGSFNYWPDASNYYSGWSDIYAGHFLTEAKKKGYFVPTDMYDNWKRSEHSYAIKCKVENFRSVINRKNESAYYNVYYRTREQLYRLYVLAIAGEPEIGAMNIMKETNLSYLDDAEKWMLAMSYKLAGINETANSISNLAGILVEDYTEMSGSFGTADRDKAVILTGLCEAGNEAKAASLYSNLVDRINSDEWLSTQTLGFVMLSIGKFMEKYPEYFNVTSKLSGRIVTERDGEVKFKFSDLTYTKELESGSKDIVTVTLDKDTEAEKCFVSLNYDAIPLKPADKREGKGIYIERTFITKSGKTGALKTVQGETFTMKIKIKKSATNELKNMALVQILPSGWEIENARLENRNAYTSASTKKNYGYSSSTYNYSQQIRYTDIRDDRVMWFFDMEKQTKEIEFVIELRAVSVGKFYLSPTVAESMYSKDFFALEPGMKVEVVK
ncbi:MAG: hypothetical protein L6407_07600, partial [Candidatus Delongbacteria bacterium]|nr:hypothetical protein [Candidatus Delongbacteria bacterium]